MKFASSLRKCGCHSSCPGDLFESSVRNLSLTISGVMFIVDRTSTSGMDSTNGIFSRFSEVKTLAKNWLSVSALSFGFVALEPSGFVKVGMPCLDLSIERAYFQNLFGLNFTLAAMSCSKTPKVPC